MEDITATIEKLKALRTLGVGVRSTTSAPAIRRSATSPSSRCRRLKIDGPSFILMLKEPDTMTLVSTMISLAARSVNVRRGGVDSEDQANFLRLARCDEMQGH